MAGAHRSSCPRARAGAGGRSRRAGPGSMHRCDLAFGPTAWAVGVCSRIDEGEMKPRSEAPELANPRGGMSGLKLVLLGAVMPLALAGVVVGGVALTNTPRRDAAVASAEALDCSSPRHSWRWACQQAKS